MSMGPVHGPNGPGDLLAALKAGRVQGGETARLRSASQLMEAQFYQELFKAMRSSVPEDRLMGGGEGEEMFTSLMDQHLAESAAAQSERGIGAALYRHFLSMVSNETGSETAAPSEPIAPEAGLPIREAGDPLPLSSPGDDFELERRARSYRVDDGS